MFAHQLERATDLLYDLLNYDNLLAPDIHCLLNELLLGWVHKEHVCTVASSWICSVWSCLQGRRRVHSIDHAIVHILDALRLLLHWFEEGFTVSRFVHGQRTRLSIDLFLVQMVVLHPHPLTLLTGNDSFWLQLGQWTVFILFHHAVDVFFIQGQEFLLRWLLSHWNIYFVTEITGVIKLHAPSELVAKDLCDFEMRFDFGT